MALSTLTPAKVASALSKLSLEERRYLERAASGNWEGGDRIQGALLETAKEAQLVYTSSARLRSLIYKTLIGDEPVFAMMK